MRCGKLLSSAVSAWDSAARLQCGPESPPVVQGVPRLVRGCLDQGAELRDRHARLGQQLRADDDLPVDDAEFCASAFAHLPGHDGDFVDPLGSEAGAAASSSVEDDCCPEGCLGRQVAAAQRRILDWEFGSFQKDSGSGKILDG